MSDAMTLALAKIEAQARRTALHAIKTAARRYRRDRLAMQSVHLELPFATPARSIAILGALIEQERREPRRLFGFGGEGPLVNAKGARLLARWERRFDRAESNDNAQEAA